MPAYIVTLLALFALLLFERIEAAGAAGLLRLRIRMIIESDDHHS